MIILLFIVSTNHNTLLPFLQKQYIFLYRALLDTATYGNTDIALALMPSTIESLKFKPNDGKCLLETEFEV